jgi:predicted transcriptional regulator of viral defense system
MQRDAARKGVAAYLDRLQEQRGYTLTREQLLAEAGVSTTAAISAVGRLKKKGRLTEARRGFLVLLPLEFRAVGSLPPAWWAGALMEFLAQRYYVGLHSAAAYHGVVPHPPRVFQVVTDRATRPIPAGRMQIEFVQKGVIGGAATVDTTTPAAATS